MKFILYASFIFGFEGYPWRYKYNLKIEVLEYVYKFYISNTEDSAFFWSSSNMSTHYTSELINASTSSNYLFILKI